MKKINNFEVRVLHAYQAKFGIKILKLHLIDTTACTHFRNLKKSNLSLHPTGVYWFFFKSWRMSPGVLVTSAISKFNLTSSASVHIQNYFIWRWSCGSFGDVVTHWECTRLLGQRSWVRIRHIPQKSWCTAGSLFNNVETSQGRDRNLSLRQKIY